MRFPNGISDLRDQLLHHPLYEAITTPLDVCRFMESHVYCVWDFQCLLKGLQKRITCVDLPWLPTPDPEARRLLNEIVLAEETDDDGNGGYLSHFELYRAAMVEAGADVGRVDQFLAILRAGESVEEALRRVQVPQAACNSIVLTMWQATRATTHELAAAFTWGREDLIPDLFQRLLNRLGEVFPQRFGRLKFYLERHVELDGECHGKQARRLLERVCDGDSEKWAAAENAARASLVARLALWDEILRSLVADAQSAGAELPHEPASTGHEHRHTVVSNMAP